MKIAHVKTPQPLIGGVFALPIFPGGMRRVSGCGRQMTTPHQWLGICRAPQQAARQVLSCRPQVSGGHLQA